MGWKELSRIATSPRLPLLTGVIGVAGAVAAVLTGTWPATAAVAGPTARC
ncbi:hypothetical protein AB0K16_49790 [Nonomuraea jabiensis]